MSDTADLFQTPELLDDPSSILVNFTSAMGPASVYMSEFDTYMKSIVVLGIIFGTRIGLSALALPVTFMITKNKRSPIFILNMLCLLLLFLQSCIYAVTLTKTYNTITYAFSGYMIIDKAASNISVVSNLFYVILIGLVEVSFCYQVYIIFDSPQKSLKRIGYGTTGLSIALGLASFVLYFVYMVYSNLAFYNNNVTVPKHLVNTPLILFVTSSCAIMLMLMLKLAFAIRTRRYLGLTQFNMFHILFIMSFQTMVIPTILILISFNQFSDTDLYSSQTFSALGTALITISLPLTTMWANSAISNSSPTSVGNLQSPVYSSSGEDNKTFVSSPTDYYPKISSDSERMPNTATDSEKLIIPDHASQLNSATPQDDQAFWKEIEMYTKDLDKHSPKGQLLDGSDRFSKDKLSLGSR